jgi:hypothetical protein
MRTCYLHIGHAKTATSSLQTFMHKNDELFEACGVWVPGDFRPFKSFNCKAIAEAGKTFSGNLAPVFNAKAKGDQVQANTLLDHIFSRDADVLLSTELIFYYKFMVREVIAFANKRGFSVMVVAYLRRQDRAIIPTYYQNIRNHGYFKNVLTFLDETADMRYFRYAEVIDAYAMAAPNRIVIRTFEPEFLVAGDIVDDFVAALGLNIPMDRAQRMSRNYSRIECARPRGSGAEGYRPVNQGYSARRKQKSLDLFLYQGGRVGHGEPLHGRQ